MKRLIVCDVAKFNAFSLNMLNCDVEATMWKLSPEQLEKEIAVADKIESYVGHQTTADIFSEILGVEITMNRETFKINTGEEYHILVGQYTGPRLEEGAKELPAGAKIVWWIVEIKTFSL